LAAKKGITVTNSPGTIDQNYTGDIKVIIQNTGNEIFEINKYDRIAQIVFTKIPIVKFNIVDKLDESDRGSNGFGSSGV
jgi:dUTP pyrophosphatase